MYVGGYSSVFIDQSGSAVAEVGETVLRNASIILKSSRFSACTSRRFSLTNVFGGSVHGGSFSFHVGAYAWSARFSSLSNSSSTCGATSASGVSVGISDTPCSNCSALTSSGGESLQANAYGGSMSVFYIGSRAWSFAAVGSFGLLSRSFCNSTWVIDLSVFIADSTTLLTKAVSSKCCRLCLCLHV